jgi:hypothetical protein
MTAPAPEIATARRAKAQFILNEALKLDIRVGTNGDDVLALFPLKLPADVRRSFERAIDEHQQEIMAFILAEQGNG